VSITRRVGCVVLGVLLSAGAAHSQDSLHERIAEIVQAEAELDLFSGTVLVAEDGRIVYAKGFGEANKEYHAPNVLETRFNISSVQKAFIATLTMQLIESDVLDLDDPLKKFYPDCPWTGADRIKIRHLLNHTCGLGDYRDSEEYRMNSERYEDIGEVLPLVYATEPAFAAGTRFRYSNAGVLLLKGILEKVTGKRMRQLLEERIWRLLGMEQTTLFVGGDLLDHRASAYRLGGDGNSYLRVLGEPSAYSGGGIYTTVLDLLKFDQALYGDSLLERETVQLMFTTEEVSPNYAFGWEIADRGGTRVISHGGGSGGFGAELRRYPEKGYTLVVLSNYGAAAYTVADKIENMLLGLPYELASVADLRFKRGMYLQSRESWARAIALFESNITDESPHLPSLYQSARTRLLGEFDQKNAIALLDRYIALADETARPSVAAAWWRKGVAYEQMGKIDEAIACHEKSLELDKGFEFAAEALEKLGTSD
jgi:CubicO group peptidase (beta-lactamase class C family)